MKIRKIAAICKANATAVLWDVTDTEGVVHQWICAGSCAYPVEGLPYLTVSHMVTVLDLSEKQAEKMKIEQTPAPQSFDFSDTADGEVMAREASFSVVYGGKVYLPVWTGAETRFIDFEQLRPIVEGYKGVQIFLRETRQGMPYFAVKAGLLLVGIMLPSVGLEALAEAMSNAADSYRE